LKADEITIRQGRIQDLENLIELLKELFSIEADFTFDAVLQGKGLTRILEDNSGRSCIMVAEGGGRVIGMCSAQLLISTAEGGPAALIEDMVIIPEYRGKGAGKSLLNAVESWSVQKGATRIQLLADKNNCPALDFYMKNGWGMTQLICLRKNTGES